MALHENFDTPRRTSPAPVESLESRVAKLEAAVKQLQSANETNVETAKAETPKAPEKK